MMRMPVVFIGHGSPMNAVEDNEFTRTWIKIAAEIPEPSAILAVSAHWYTEGTRINDEANPRMIYDMYGFPEELYKVNYNAPGSPDHAHITIKLIKKNVIIDNSWGFDHGTWSVLNVMYPDAHIPVYQLSINRTLYPEEHFNIGKQIMELRDKGVLILASGNIVHNLYRINFSMDKGYDWAYEFDNFVSERITGRNFDDIINYSKAGKSAEFAFTIPDHYYPLLYALGASSENDNITFYNQACIAGSLSMTCCLFK
jgi:4,5-DOPA dioxygenase extradiol